MRIIKTNKGTWGIMTKPREIDGKLINRACYLRENNDSGFPIHMDFSTKMSDESIKEVIDKAVINIHTEHGDFFVETLHDEEENKTYHLATRKSDMTDTIRFEAHETLHDIVDFINKGKDNL